MCGLDRVRFSTCSVAILVLAGCATTEPDVVATEQSARNDGSLTIPTITACRAGKYDGTFSNRTGADAAPVSTLKGNISFSLVRVSSGEFYQISNGAKLDGKSDSGDTFSADIDSDNGACREGQFNVHLVNGEFRLPVPDGSAAPTASFPFVGMVEGVYASRPEGEGFIGYWQAYWPNYRDGGAPIMHGVWSATWSGAN